VAGVATSGAVLSVGCSTGQPGQRARIASPETAGEDPGGRRLVPVSDGEITETGIKIADQIRKDGNVIGTTAEQLKPFDCAE
jgi:hypothetical protein